MSDFGITPDLVPSVNAVAGFLALDQFRERRSGPRIDMVVLAGNAILPTATSAFTQAKAMRIPLLITGGIGSCDNTTP